MKKILLLLLVAFIGIQFFPIDKSNPPVDQNQDFIMMYKPTAEIASKIKASCYDCHSNESKYPWYSNIQPVGWYLKNHIEDGKKHLNFSVFGTYSPKKQAHKLEESYELIEKGEMPLSSYTLIHKDAVLTAAEQATLIAYFKELKQNFKE